MSFAGNNEDISFDGSTGAGFVGQTQVVEFDNITHLTAGNGTLGFIDDAYSGAVYSFNNMGDGRIALTGDLSNDTIHVQGNSPELSIPLGITSAININLATSQFSSFGYAAGTDPTITGNAAITTLVIGADNRIATDFASGRAEAQIIGSQEDETLAFLSAGADTLVGGGGIDTLDYSGLAYPNGQDTLYSLSINLVTGIAQTPEQYEYSRDFHFNGHVGFYSEYFDPNVSVRLLDQQISEFENVIGSVGDDTISGDQFSNVLASGDGNDILVGSFVDAIDTTAAKIYRIYQATLGRTPDTGGFVNWTNRLDSGALTFQEIVHGFVASKEFKNVYGALNNTEFVTLLYNNVLDREPDTAGLNAWVTRISEGSSREQIVIGFAQSPEFKTITEAESTAYANAFFGWKQGDYLDDIFRLYQATLDRTPDQKGLEAWTSRLMDGQAYTTIAEGFTNSTEFQNIYGALDSEEFVRLLYQNVLDREPDLAGLTNWTRAIDEGGSREAVVRGFAQSSEFIQKSQDAFETYIRSLEGDVLDGGAGNDILWTGYSADMFVFDAKDRGSDVVLQVDTWDTLEFSGFGYNSDADILSRLTVEGPDIIFEDQGVRIQFLGVDQSTLESVDYILS
ncbi:DUF4214 domain-containing protein [Phaeobacter sp. J2-8]|uniref:DUF4214 domain-containing protein n=1 Tax=Phaeobacter sp. J2-8 TaxID=2931394 RepID=UPI001FD2C5B6|nr:DUF4214 domain-containing protein [Phaeobacter sp. J2-8]MCJ7874855.1 DUF4214 domain-containing protein [Phaeobacter sp. J2-8]